MACLPATLVLQSTSEGGWLVAGFVSALLAAPGLFFTWRGTTFLLGSNWTKAILLHPPRSVALDDRTVHVELDVGFTTPRGEPIETLIEYRSGIMGAVFLPEVTPSGVAIRYLCKTPQLARLAAQPWQELGAGCIMLAMAIGTLLAFR